jgi:hypothetical protein
MFSLNVGVSNFSFSVGYNIYKNSISLDETQDAENPSIAISTYGNMEKKNKILSASVSYFYNYSVFSGVVSFDVNKPFVIVSYLNACKKMNKAICLLKLSTNIKLHENTSVDCSYLLRSKGDSKNMEWKSYNNLGLSVNQHLFKKMLLLAISVDDIFRNNKSNRWTSYSNNILYKMDTNPDSRSLILTVRYSWGSSQKSIQKKSSNTDSINRM